MYGEIRIIEYSEERIDRCIPGQTGVIKCEIVKKPRIQFIYLYHSKKEAQEVIAALSKIVNE